MLLPEQATDDYEVTHCVVNDLSNEDIESCIALVADGGAVEATFVRQSLPNAVAIVIARKHGRVVGVATIKPTLAQHAATISRNSGIPLNLQTPELGYVAVHTDHRGQQLSRRLVQPLVESVEALIATTSNDAMKATLSRVGFVKWGAEWIGRRGDKISLWTRGLKPEVD